MISARALKSTREATCAPLRIFGTEFPPLRLFLRALHNSAFRFSQFFQRLDNPARPPADLLADLTNRAALARNLDFLAAADASIPILTVHQSKGLEFDTVAYSSRNMP